MMSTEQVGINKAKLKKKEKLNLINSILIDDVGRRDVKYLFKPSTCTFLNSSKMFSPPSLSLNLIHS